MHGLLKVVSAEEGPAPISRTVARQRRSRAHPESRTPRIATEISVKSARHARQLRTSPQLRSAPIETGKTRKMSWRTKLPPIAYETPQRDRPHGSRKISPPWDLARTSTECVRTLSVLVPVRCGGRSITVATPVTVARVNTLVLSSRGCANRLPWNRTRGRYQ